MAWYLSLAHEAVDLDSMSARTPTCDTYCLFPLAGLVDDASILWRKAGVNLDGWQVRSGGSLIATASQDRPTS